MDYTNLINAKAMYCPVCGKPMNTSGQQANANSALGEGYCDTCNKAYHWVAFINKDDKVEIAGFCEVYGVAKDDVKAPY